MLKSYEAIYDHGRVEWIGAVPRLARGRVLVVVEESTDAVDSFKTNGDRLADFLDNLGIEARKATSEKFGDPVSWQRNERQEHFLPGRQED